MPDEPQPGREPGDAPRRAGHGSASTPRNWPAGRFPYQYDRSLVEDVDLVAATPGADINWLEDIHLLHEDGVPAVFDRYSNSFLKIHFEIPAGREDENARKVLITHLRRGQLLRHLAEAQARQVPAAGTRPVARARRPSETAGSPP